MEFDAFTGGVEPGGLRTKNEILILICYLLSGPNISLSKDEILQIMQDNGFANYFEVTDALSELTAKGNLLAQGEPPVYTASSQAKMIAKQLDTALPLSIREKAMAAVIQLLARTRREKENLVEIKETTQGCNVVCHVSGGELELMEFSLYVPDRHQAEIVKRNFQAAPQNVYQLLLALVTNNYALAKEIFKEQEKNETTSPSKSRRSAKAERLFYISSLH